MKKSLRERVSYANVMSTLALFLALGGTSYALTLPRNSVGSKQIRTKAVGTSELATGAVRTGDVRDRTLRLRDLSLSTRSALRGATGATGPVGAIGPAGPTYRAAIDSGGGLIRGNPKFKTKRGVNDYIVEFDRPATECVATASLTLDEGATNLQPQPGYVTVSREGVRWVVRTYDATGNAQGRAINVIAAC
jgi:hypothetical protein